MDLEFDQQATGSNDDFLSLDLGSSFSISASNQANTYKQALNVILNKGPELGVHTILQVDKISNLLFEDLIAKEIFKMFKHVIMHKSDELTAGRLNLRDDIHLENLSNEEERMRAYYYNEEIDEYTLLTPYSISKI